MILIRFAFAFVLGCKVFCESMLPTTFTLTTMSMRKGINNTPFCVDYEAAQMATLPSLIYAHKVGVLNEKRCKTAPLHR